MHLNADWAAALFEGAHSPHVIFQLCAASAGAICACQMHAVLSLALKLSKQFMHLCMLHLRTASLPGRQEFYCMCLSHAEKHCNHFIIIIIIKIAFIVHYIDLTACCMSTSSKSLEYKHCQSTYSFVLMSNNLCSCTPISKHMHHTCRHSVPHHPPLRSEEVTCRH